MNLRPTVGLRTTGLETSALNIYVPQMTVLADMGRQEPNKFKAPLIRRRYIARASLGKLNIAHILQQQKQSYVFVYCWARRHDSRYKIRLGTQQTRHSLTFLEYEGSSPYQRTLIFHSILRHFHSFTSSKTIPETPFKYCNELLVQQVYYIT